jgi:signal transduction histidine kinase
MSHELRTPLTAIQMYTDIVIEDLEEGSGTTKTHVADLNKVMGASEHLLSLIEDVLDLAKIESGRTDLILEETSLEDILKEVISQATPLIANNDNTFVVDAEQVDLNMFTDKKRVTQILLNVLSNSAKFTKMGTVALRVIPDRRGVVFQIEDTGIGMTDAQVEKVWGEFEQADSSTSKKYGGTGLGLALSKKLVTVLGGKITMVSCPGVGTTVTLKLPARSAYV